MIGPSEEVKRVVQYIDGCDCDPVRDYDDVNRFVSERYERRVRIPAVSNFKC